MQFTKLGATALAGIFLALATVSAPAVAQTSGAAAPAPVVLNKQMIGPASEAQKAMGAQDWATATAKINAAAGLAKTPQEKLWVEQIRLSIAVSTKDLPAQIATINAILASGSAPPDQVKLYKGAIAKVYAEAGDTAKSVAAFREYLDTYGATHEQLAALASDMGKTGDHANAISYGNKAIEAARAAGIKPPEGYYRTVMLAHSKAGDMTSYYATEEVVVLEYPKEPYWKELIARAQKEPNYGSAMYLNVYRTLLAAGVKLTPEQISFAANTAAKNGFPNEAVQLLEPAIAAGQLGSNALDTENLAKARDALVKDKAGLPEETRKALAGNDADYLAILGEAHLSYGDYAKSAEVLQAALSKGIADSVRADGVRLLLGIAQFNQGQKDAALATWANVKADNGAAMLARSWTLIAKSKA